MSNCKLLTVCNLALRMRWVVLSAVISSYLTNSMLHELRKTGIAVVTAASCARINADKSKTMQHLSNHRSESQR